MNASSNKRKMPRMSQGGWQFIELLFATSIILILCALAVPMISRMKDRQIAALGINKVMQIKGALDQMAHECQGYPEKPEAQINDLNALTRIVDPCGGGAGCPPYPIGKPTSYPKHMDCETVYLKKLITGDMLAGVCDVSNTDCYHNVSNENMISFTSGFVSDGAYPGCSVSGNGKQTGWNYTLLANTAKPLMKPVPVVCANILLGSGSVTAVINGGGVFNNTQVEEGSGHFAPDGNPLQNACPCGAWCRNNITHEQGCCKSCVSNGVTISGLGFKY